MTTNNNMPKDPYADDSYLFDWAPLTNGTPGGIANWLQTGETIATHTITITPTGLTNESSSQINSNTSVKVRLSGGVAGETYTVKCKITTSSNPPRKDARTINVIVGDR